MVEFGSFLSRENISKNLSNLVENFFLEIEKSKLTVDVSKHDNCIAMGLEDSNIIFYKNRKKYQSIFVLADLHKELLKKGNEIINIEKCKDKVTIKEKIIINNRKIEKIGDLLNSQLNFFQKLKNEENSSRFIRKETNTISKVIPENLNETEPKVRKPEKISAIFNKNSIHSSKFFKTEKKSHLAVLK